MLITCPFCGPRDSSEFTYLGDATQKRPDPEGPDAQKKFYELVYLRDNPAGKHTDLWHHIFGCRCWLRVTRDTRTHEIYSVELEKKNY